MNRTEATQILMLNSDATFDDIKYAYRKLSLKLHPDRNKNEKDGRRFKNVLDAYHFLKGQNKLENSHYKNKSTQKKSNDTYHQHNTGEDWSRFTKDSALRHLKLWYIRNSHTYISTHNTNTTMYLCGLM